MNPGRRFYALLLRALPSEFRASCGAELLDTYDEMRSELGPRPGILRLGRFHAKLCVDLVSRIRPERARVVRRNGVGSTTMEGPFLSRPGVGFVHAVERFGRDIRMAARSLRKRPVFLLVATLSLGIGIGANTAIFSLVNAVFLEKYPYRAPHELVRIYTSVAGRSDYGTTSYPNFRDLREFEGPFQAAGAFKLIVTQLELQDETVMSLGEGVSQTLFPMLGVEAVVGRTFLPEEDETPGSHLVMMLSHGFWQRAFGSDPGVVGRTVRLAGTTFSVVGVTPEGFNGLTAVGVAADFFVPLVNYGVASGERDHEHFDDRMNRRHMVVARLAAGVERESARAQLAVLTSQIQDAYPQTDLEWSFSMLPIGDVALDPDVDNAIKPFVFLLMIAGCMVLLLACTNLASFLLARGTTKRKETALQLALGAGRGTLVRQLLTETVILALLGGALGILLATWILGILAAEIMPSLLVPITLDLGLNWAVIRFTFGISALAGLLFGLVPALQCTSLGLLPVLKDETGTVRVRRFGIRSGLVAAQMALSVVLLIGGGLFIRSLGAARDADVGFSLRDAGIVWVDLSTSDLPVSEYRNVRNELMSRARALPGIDAVTAASHIPFFRSASGGFYSIPGLESPARGGGHNVQREEVDEVFFETMGIPLVEGRRFSPDDRPRSPLVAIVNETAANWFWPDGSPVGREFSNIGTGMTFQVVGVVGNTKIERLREPARPLFYFPIAQRAATNFLLVARGPVDAVEITAMLQRMIKEVNSGLLIVEETTFEESFSVILFPARMTALLLGAFGALALVLAAIGLYGVVNFSVSQRTQEVGIRLSLGADAWGVTAMVMRSALVLVGLGGAVGLAAAIGLAQLVRHFLFGVGPWDPATFLGVPLLLVSVAALAALIPARRASKVNPVDALRYE